MTFNIETNDTPFGELSDEDAATLFIAWRHGRSICCFVHRFQWLTWTRPEWLPTSIYRAEPLPIIPASFDFVGPDPKWRFCAADADGAVYLYTEKPILRECDWGRDGGRSIEITELFPSYIRGTVDWAKTLIERVLK